MKWIICLLNQTPQRTAVEEMLENYRSYTREKRYRAFFSFTTLKNAQFFWTLWDSNP